MKRIYDVTVTNGEYQNSKGETKKSYLKIGTVFERPDGTQCMKIESIPVNWEGWANFYAPKLKELASKLEGKSFTAKEHDAPESDEIPF